MHETAASIEGIVEYLDQVFSHHYKESDASIGARYAKVFELFTQHEDEVARPFMEFLNSNTNVRIIGIPEIDYTRRVSTISFTVEGQRHSDIATKLGEQNIGIGVGGLLCEALY